MRRMGRSSVLIMLIATFVLGFSLSALAASEGGEGGEDEGAGEATTTTIATGLSPAVEVGDDAPAEATADWTYRYMIPTALALAAVIILFTAIRYFTDVVRKRYRIVEE